MIVNIQILKNEARKNLWFNSCVMSNCSNKRTQGHTAHIAPSPSVTYSMGEISERSWRMENKQRNEDIQRCHETYSAIWHFWYIQLTLTANKDLWHNLFFCHIYQHLQRFRCWWFQSFIWQQQWQTTVKGCLIGGSLSLSTAAFGSVSGCAVEYWWISV